MPVFKLVVFSRPVAGREESYVEWYENTHLAEVCQLSGVKSARRYSLSRNMSEREPYPYMTIYNIDTDDIDAVLADLQASGADGHMLMSDAIDLDTVYPMVFEPCGAEVKSD
jgi:hypothetical protein